MPCLVEPRRGKERGGCTECSREWSDAWARERRGTWRGEGPEISNGAMWTGHGGSVALNGARERSKTESTANVDPWVDAARGARAVVLVDRRVWLSEFWRGRTERRVETKDTTRLRLKTGQEHVDRGGSQAGLRRPPSPGRGGLWPVVGLPVRGGASGVSALPGASGRGHERGR
eukprot:3320056-Prymnesium_polylepis.2